MGLNCLALIFHELHAHVHGVFGGLFIPAFSLILSLNSPVYQVKMLCFALVCIGDFKLSQLRCGFESHLSAAFFFGKSCLRSSFFLSQSV